MLDIIRTTETALVRDVPMYVSLSKLKTLDEPRDHLKFWGAMGPPGPLLPLPLMLLKYSHGVLCTKPHNYL